MPRIVYVPNVMEPHKREVIECRVGLPVARALPPYLDFDRCQCIRRGKVEPVDLWKFQFVDEQDELIVRVVPRGIGEAIFLGGAAAFSAKVGFWASVAAVATNLLIAAAVSFGIGQLVNALLPAPKKRQAEGEDTPTYGWNGIQNTSQNGLVIPLVYGEHKVAGQYLSTFTDIIDGGKSELSMLVGLSAGPVSAINGYTTDQDALSAANSGTGLEINGNSGTLFSGMTASYRLGNWDQAVINGFDDVKTQYDLSQEISAEGTDGLGYVYTTVTDTQAAELFFTFPNGLYKMTSSGAFLQYRCRISVRYREDESTASWTTAETVTFEAESRSEWNCMHRLEFPHAGQYQIDVSRLTATDGAYTVSRIYITGVKEVQYDDIAYRGVALYGIKAIASEQLNGALPSCSCIVHGREVTVYHPDDDFGADTEQSFTSDSKVLWGWTAVNTANVTTATANTYAAHTLSILQNTTAASWLNADRTGPYVYKEITGNFDVRARCTCAGGTTSTVGAALLVQSPTDLTDWIYIGSRFASSTQYVYGLNTVDSTSTAYASAASTDTYFRLVRSGSSVYAYSSADGTTWTQRGSTQTRADFPDELRVGLMSATPSNTTGTHRANFTGFEFADSTAYSVECSSNPAWVIYDLLTDTHYGIGSYVDTSQIDLDSFQDFADYCNTAVSDGDNGTHRRHRFDGLLDAQRGAWEVINRIAENSRAAVLMQGDKIHVLWQAERSAVQLFAMSNIKAGSWAQVYQSPEVGGNVWEVQYLNADNDYEQDYATYIDPEIPSGEPYRRESITAYGITRPAEARRKALWHCKANRYLKSMVSFETGLDAIACEPGDRIEVQHDVPAWGNGGRVMSATSTSVTLDHQVTLAAGSTYQVRIQHAADDTIETRTVQDAAGSYWTLTVLPVWTLTPSADDVWTVGVTSVLTKPFIVSSIKRTSDLECAIEAIEYVAGAYDDEIDTVDYVSYSTLPDPRAIPGAVTNLVVTERAMVLNDGTIRNVIDVTYGLPSGTNRANVYWRESDMATWLQAGRPYTTHFTIESNVTHGTTYDICVAAVSSYGLHRHPDACDYVSLTIVGKTTAPSDVTNVRVTLVGDMIYVRWDAITDDDLQGYEVRYGPSTWSTCTVLGQTTSTQYVTTNVSGGHEAYYQVKAFNTSGVYSATAAYEAVTLPERFGENLIIERNEEDEGWDGVKVDTEVDGSTHLILDQTQTAPATSGTYETPVIDCGATIRSLVSVWLKVTQSYASLTWADATFTWGSSEGQALTWAGPTGESHVTATLTFRYGDALGTDGGVDGDYETFQVGEYSGRYFQFKLTLSVDNIEYNAVVEEMITKIDVPDLICSATNVAIASSGSTVITYTTAMSGFQGFNVTPDFVAIPYAPTNPGDFVSVDAVTATTATVRYFNVAGSQVAGACTFIAKGY